MEYWNESLINFGTIRRGKTRDFVFKANINMPAISSISTSCGCTKASYHSASKELRVKYSAGEIPKHISGNQPVTQTIFITYTNGELISLYLKGIKLR